MRVFVFTDIEGSTRLGERRGEARAEALPKHGALVSGLIPERGGRIVKHGENAVAAVFLAGSPAAWATKFQRRPAREDWGPGGGLRVRVALHRGEAEARSGGDFGPAANRAAGLCQAAGGGQVLITPGTARVVELPTGAALAELGVHLRKDLGEPQEVLQLPPPDLPVTEFPPRRSLSSRPHNSSPPPTPFLGRAEEVAAVAAHLRDPNDRLITPAGPGGNGKTRLSLQTAAEAADDFTRGVYSVPLAPVSSVEFLASAGADALHFTCYGRDAPQAEPVNYLREKELLPGRENFERLAKGAAFGAERREAAPGLKVLATSRERLNLRGERVVEIGGRRFPEEGGVGGGLRPGPVAEARRTGGEACSPAGLGRVGPGGACGGGREVPRGFGNRGGGRRGGGVRDGRLGRASRAGRGGGTGPGGCPLSSKVGRRPDPRRGRGRGRCAKRFRTSSRPPRPRAR